MGDVFSFDERQYFTSEAHDSVEVCVVHDSGDLEEPVELTVCTAQRNAISKLHIVWKAKSYRFVLLPIIRFL